MEWCIQTGARVVKGDVIAVVETSKAMVEIIAPESGFLHYNALPGSKILVADELAVITDKQNSRLDANASNGSDVAMSNAENDAKYGDEQPGVRFSKRAIKMIKENRIDASVFIGYGMVGQDEVAQYLKASAVKERKFTEAQKKGRILIFGGGGHSMMCIDILRQMGEYEILGIVDDTLRIGDDVLGIPVIGGASELSVLHRQGVRHIINGIGAVENHSLRERAYQDLKRLGYTFPNLIHPKAAIEPSAMLGEGNQIMAHATVGSIVKIGNNCIVNSGAVVSHGSVLSDNVHVAPGALLAGNVFVGNNTLIGMGSTIYLRVKVGEGVLIHNGCRITRNVKDYTTVTA